MAIAAMHACLLNVAIYRHYPDYLVGSLTDKTTVGALMLDGDDQDYKQRSTSTFGCTGPREETADRVFTKDVCILPSLSWNRVPRGKRKA